MTIDERLELLKNRIPLQELEGLEDKFFLALIECARAHIMKTRYPFNEEKAKGDVEERYQADQIEICLRIFAKTGAEGEISHSEAGISRAYYDASGFQDILNSIVPYCGTL